MMLSLRAGTKIYLNGAVIKVDRKVNLELLNDATFLLENHVLQANEATTPLRQLYFVLQTMLMDPMGAPFVRSLLDSMLASMIASFEDAGVIAGLRDVEASVKSEKIYEAMKKLRRLYPNEEAILTGSRARKTAAIRAA